MSTEQFANNAQTTLAAAVPAAVAGAPGTITVPPTTAGFPAGPQFRVRVGGELMLVTAVAGTTWAVTRGVEGTAAAAHAAGDAVTQVLTAGALQELAGNAAVSAGCYNSANLSLGHATWTALAFNSENWDSDGIHSTAGNTSRFTIPTGRAGKWLFTGFVQFAASASGQRAIRFVVNAASAWGYVLVNANVGITTNLSANTVVNLAAGDYVELQAYQSSGGVLAAEAVGSEAPGMTATWLGA